MPTYRYDELVGCPLDASQQQSVKRPPCVLPRRRPLNTWAAFEAAHQTAARKLSSYLLRDRIGSVRLEGDALTELDPQQAIYLPANNALARMQYAQIAAKHVQGTIEALSLDQSVFFVTLINRDHTVREDAAPGFSIRRLHSWARQILRSCSHVGMAEGALYSNLDVIGAGYRRAVSWHTHSVVWDIAEKEIAEIIADANQRYQAVIDGIDAAHYRVLAREEVTGQTFYMNKGQISEYRVWPRRRSITDWDTGEINIVGTGRFNQAKRDLRPGDMARMCKVFAGRSLDQLAFAGGAGREVLQAIRHEARTAQRRHESQEAAKRSVSGRHRSVHIRSRD